MLKCITRLTVLTLILCSSVANHPKAVYVSVNGKGSDCFPWNPCGFEEGMKKLEKDGWRVIRLAGGYYSFSKEGK